MTPCTAGEIRPLLADMIPDVDTTRMGVYEIMNLIKAMLRDRFKSEKALDSYMDQIVDRLKAMAGSDVTGVDEGLTRIEAQFKEVNDRCKSLRTNLCLSHDMPASVVLDRAIVTLENAQTENAYMHRIMGRVQAKVNALLLNPREKITDVCQVLDAVQAEYDHVKDKAMLGAGLAAERGAMISDAIGELRLILGTPKTEDLTLAKIVDLLKVKSSEGREYHARLCGAVHVLTSTPMNRVVDETVRALGARDYFVKSLLSRFVNEGVNVDGKTVDEVLAMIEAEQKILTERLGTSYEREMTLVKELADAKTRLATAGKESADLARALVSKTLDVFAANQNRANLIKDLDGETHAYRKALDLDKSAWHGAIVAKIEELTANANTGLDPIREAMNMRGADMDMLVAWCESMRHKLSAALEQARDANKRCVSLGNDLNKIYDLAHVSRSAGLPMLWAKITRMRDIVTKGEGESMSMIESLSKSADTFKAERETSIRFFDDMRTVLDERNATPKYIVDTVDKMRRDMASIKSTLGHSSATTREVLTQIQAMHDGANRVRDAIGLRSDAPIDYVVQRIADTRRDMLWAQGTVSMVSAALTGSQTAERTEIMATLSGTIKGRERAQERAADLYATLCTDLNMPTTLNLDEIRDRVQGLITLRSNMRTFLGKDMTDEQLLDQVTHLISLRSEYQGMSDTLSILRQSLGLGVDCDKTTIVDKVVSIVNKGEDRNMAMERRALIRFLNMAESSTWHEITNEVVRRISYKDGFISGINDLIKDAAKAVGMDPAQTTLPLPSLIQYVNACKDSLLAVVGHPGGETLSLTTSLALLQSKSEYVASTLGLCKYASLDKVGDAVKNLLKDRDNQARMVATLNVPIEGRSKTRERLLTLLCEDPNRAGTMTTDEVVDLLKSKFACLALNLSLPENATLNEIMDRIRGMTPPMLALRELVLTLHTTKTMDANEAMAAAADKIKDMRQGLLDLLNNS